MDRFWFLTWTTYGTWLPGDTRGFVSRVRENRHSVGTRIEHDQPGTPVDHNLPGLKRSASTLLKGAPVRLTAAQAVDALADFQRTAAYRGWDLLAAAVMANHVHLVVGAPGDPDPAKLLQIFKSYASRSLNTKYQRPGSGTWWTESGSRRKLADEVSVLSAMQYVAKQEYPLALYVRDVD